MSNGDEEVFMVIGENNFMQLNYKDKQFGL